MIPESKNYTIVFIIILPIVLFTSSCKKYLDAKSQLSLEVPSTIADLQAILNQTSPMNKTYPDYVETATDDYYIPYALFTPLFSYPQFTLNYTWDPQAPNGDWEDLYAVVFDCNTVLDYLPKVTNDSSSEVSNQVKGAALFFRGYYFFETAFEFSPPYSQVNISNPYGIVLRLSSNVTDKSLRSNVGDSYNQILADLKEATQLLPITTEFPTLPNRPAAFAALARVYLAMSDYNNAGIYADSCLKLYNTLMDYNNIDSTKYPFPLFNPEVIFHQEAPGESTLPESRACVDSILYNTYELTDLRKKLFFKNNASVPTAHSFYGGYFGKGNGAIFTGLTTDEMYLTRAECYARNGNSTAAMLDMDTLLTKRYITGTFSSLSISDPNQLLEYILLERRKELLFRGTRWADLKRLNLVPSTAITLTRNMNGTISTLPPNDLRYEMLIDANTISIANIPQNPR